MEIIEDQLKEWFMQENPIMYLKKEKKKVPILKEASYAI